MRGLPSLQEPGIQGYPDLNKRRNRQSSLAPAVFARVSKNGAISA
jgi:hypothetical protein